MKVINKIESMDQALEMLEENTVSKNKCTESIKAFDYAAAYTQHILRYEDITDEERKTITAAFKIYENKIGLLRAVLEMNDEHIAMAKRFIKGEPEPEDENKADDEVEHIEAEIVDEPHGE